MSPAERLALLERGEEPKLVARLPSGFVVMSDTQFLEGYVLLLAHPMVPHLNALDGPARAQFLLDMARVGDAVLGATGAVRINYSIYGNLDPFLHAHIVPRYANEPDALRTIPPLMHPAEVRTDPARAYDPGSHGDLQRAIAAALI